MLEPIRLFSRSLRQFAIGLGPAILMAFVCLAIQVALGMMAVKAWDVVLPPEPFDPAQLFEPETWRERLRDGITYVVPTAVLYFFHALVALILTAWLLRRPARLDPAAVLRRAARGAGLFSLTATVLFTALFIADAVLPPVRVGFHVDSALMLSLWFAGSALLLPARLMGHRPAAPGFLKTTSIAAIALLPWFFASEVLGAPLRNCYECWFLFEGGLFAYPLLGVYLLGLTVSSAAVSAAACMPLGPAILPPCPAQPSAESLP